MTNFSSVLIGYKTEVLEFLEILNQLEKFVDKYNIIYSKRFDSHIILNW